MASGLALSVLLLDRFSPETPAYVQRTSFSLNALGASPLPWQLGAEEFPGGEGLQETEDASSEEPTDGSQTSGDNDQDQMAAEQDFVLADGQRVMGVEFDLGAARDRSNDLEITKPIRLNGQAIGVANLAIDEQSRLRVSSEDLSNLLPEELFARIDNGANYIEFDELRAGGLDISYDPLADVIEIVT